MTRNQPTVDPVDEPDLLGRLAALGPFFALDTHDPAEPPRPPWRPLSELVDDPPLLRARVDRARAHLAAANGRPVQAVELRVAGSVMQLGVTARLVCPALAIVALTGLAPPFALATLRWQDVLGGAFPLSLPGHDLTADSPRRALPAGWADPLVDGPIRELVQATSALSISQQVLWGNVASAVSGAAAALAGVAPPWAQPAADLAAAMLDHPALRDRGTGRPGTPGFRRRSCCLIYRAADPRSQNAVCGDCILRTAAPSTP